MFIMRFFLILWAASVLSVFAWGISAVWQCTPENGFEILGMIGLSVILSICAIVLGFGPFVDLWDED